MTGLRKTLGLLFAHEIEVVGRAFRPFRAAGRGAHRWAAASSARLRAGHSGLRADASSPPPKLRARGLPRGASRLLAGSILLSGALHGALFAAALHLWRPDPGPGGGNGTESTVTIRLIPASRPPAAVEPTEPLLPPKPLEPPVPAPVEKDRSAPPSETVGMPEPSEPAPGDPGGSLAGVANDIPPPSAPPLPLGLGASPPPLPGAGGSALQGYGSRGRGKARALALYGGSGETEGAVSRGLRWLAAHQDEGGGWSAEGYERHCRHFIPCAGKGMADYDTGVTALAILAFLGAGHVPDGPAGEALPAGATPAVDAGFRAGSPYRRNVKKALDYLLGHQDGRGAYGAVGDTYLYNHAIATFAMAEAVSMTSSRRYRESLEAALSFTYSSQQDGGGWDYTSKPSGRNDLSITGWQVMALRSAGLAGATVPDIVLERVRRFIDGAILADGQGIYANLGAEAGRRGINMVSVGLLSKLYLGAGREERRVQRAAARLIRTPPEWEAAPAWETTFQSYYYWYTATLALFHLGGEEWKAWNFFVARSLLSLQSRKPHEEGSWPPEPNWVGVSGGRIYATAINVLTLETYYRYEPMFRSRGKRS